MALLVYFVAAVVTSTLADSARERAVEAEERRREADLSADLARLVLGGTDSSDGLGEAAARIAEAVGLGEAELRLEWLDGDERRLAFPLVDAGERVGTLLVPRDLSDAQRELLERRVVPPLTRARERGHPPPAARGAGGGDARAAPQRRDEDRAAARGLA